MLKIAKYIGLIGLIVLSFYIGCPFLKLTGFTCPACGITRAWVYLFKGDFDKAFQFNAMFIPLSLTFARIAYCDFRKIKPKKPEIIVLCLVAGSTFIYNIWRILTDSVIC